MKINKKLKNEIISTLMFSIILSLFFMLVSTNKVFANDTKKLIDIWDFGAKIQEGSLYNNRITSSNIDSLENLGSNGKTINPGILTLDKGNIEITLTKQERFYYFSEDQSSRGNKSAGDPKKEYKFDGDIYDYTGKGYVYFNGAGNEETRYLLIHDIHQGDRITVYGFEDNVTSSTVHFDFQGEIKEGESVQKSSQELGTPFMYEVVAKNSGTYKLWFNSNGGKMRIHRIVRAPYVEVKGNIYLGKTGISNYNLTFVNETTKEKINAAHNNGKFNVNLAPGYNYIALLQGATGFGFSNNTKIIKISKDDILTDKNNVILKVEPKSIYTLAGTIKGISKDYDLSKLEIKMNPPKDDSVTQPQTLFIDKKTMKYSVKLDSGILYTAELIGANDYNISLGNNSKSDSNIIQDIKVDTKPLHHVRGKFINKDKSSEITGITFKNLSDGYTYKGKVNDNSYTAKLRDGDYEVNLESTTLRTLSHIVVNNKASEKDIMIAHINPVEKSYKWVSDLYVGYSHKENNFNTLKEAIKTASGMNILDEEHRVTIHIAPGIYRQQLIIDTPYLSLINEEPSKGEVKITWYYGIGYKYYSARELDSSTGPQGYYDEELSFDKYYKAPVNYWGSTVYVTSNATGFTAENIVFENSFNRYVTNEEIEDGVEVAGTSSINLPREIDSPVSNKNYKERAAAIYVKADNSEFYKCSFLSNQDTLGTGSVGTNMYFKNCLIEGGTDYIFGGGNIVFDNCQLNWFGAKDQALKGQFITAAKADDKGYLFRNAAITSRAETNSENMPSTGLFGRPWEQAAKVAFINTKFLEENIIEEKGWTSMSSAVPSKANFFEFDSTYNGQKIDTASRVKTAISDIAEVSNYNVLEFFGDNWIPTHYVADSKTAPIMNSKPHLISTDNADTSLSIDTLTVNYEFKNNNDNLNDSSLIKWYRIDKNGIETLIKLNTAYISKSYTVTNEDIDCYIKAVIIPEVTSGLKGAETSIQLSEKIKNL